MTHQDLPFQDILFENRKLKSNAKTTAETIEALENKVQAPINSLQTKTSELEDLKEIVVANPFALVLIDGNGYMFSDDLLCQNFRGGEEAAHRLLIEARNYLDHFPNGKDWKIVVRIFANLDELASLCRSLGIVKHTNVVRDFAAGFAQGQALFDFIDVGHGKDLNDHKIKGASIFPSSVYIILCMIFL